MIKTFLNHFCEARVMAKRFVGGSVPVAILTCVSLCSCASIGSDSEDEKLYTPISLYFNPLLTSNYDQYSAFFPYFANYPDDWAKMGLRNNPVYLSYISYDHWSGGDVSINYYFNIHGNLNSITTAFGTDEFVYEDGKKLVSINRVNGLNWDGKRSNEFVYAGDELVRRNASPTGQTSHSFRYYDNGVLKEIVPDRGIYYYDRMKLGLLEFNEDGQLVRTESAMTFNPFMEDAKGNNNVLPSVCVFKYNDKGLCIEKDEKIAFRKNEEPADTIRCISRYTYNRFGDILSWEYEGGCYMPINGNQWTIADRRFVISYGYQYDDEDNWVEQRVTMPSCYRDIPALLKFYEVKSKGYYVSNQSPSSSGNIPTVTIRRNIGNYYEFSASELEQKVIEEEKKADLKYTDVQCYGLKGKVKMVETAKEIVAFDKIGNIAYIEYKYKDGNMKTDFVYESPLRYNYGEDTSTIHIEFSDNERKKVCKEDSSCDELYRFDGKDRVIRHDYYEGMAPASVIYSYNGKDHNPSKSVYSGFDEMGNWTFTQSYVYLDTDKKGNWTKRKVLGKTESESYSGEGNSEMTKSVTEDEPYIETRKITYY